MAKKQTWEEYQKQMQTPGYQETIQRSLKPAGEISSYSKTQALAKYKALQKGGRKITKRRAVGTERLLKAFGVVPGSSQKSGAGRPKGSYKYSIGGKPVSVFEWRKYQAKKKLLYQQYQQQQNQRLAQKGFTPEQVQQLQQRQVIQQMQQRQMPQQQMQQQNQRPTPTNAADEELAFRQFQIQQQVSPNTQRILDTIRRIQNKGKLDNMEQQRRHFERNLVGRKMNLMKAHENMIDTTMDFTGVKEDNILNAPSVFRENPENNILRSRGRPNILQTREAGNSLWF